MIELNFDWRKSCEYLGDVRKNKLNEPLVVASVGKNLIDNYLSSLREFEKWIILEQVFAAALETGDFELSQKSLSILKSKFPASVRVARLEGIQLEGMSDFEGAVVIYDRLLAKDDTDSATMKRKISVALEKEGRLSAIDLLIEYLLVFMADSEAWSELADLYLKEHMYKQAVFCYEELILAEPQNYHYYTKCAEIKYTIGGIACILESIYYYIFSLELSPINNNRSYFGLFIAVNQLTNLGKEAVTKEMKMMVENGKKKLVTIYEKESSKEGKLILDVLDIL
jgi:tetratricopeptide (TPR) repeat protein